MKTYQGRREGHETIVTVDGRPLDLRLDLCDHSPSGFEWGYVGSGPAQLALALLANHLGNDEQALDQYQDFNRNIVACLDKRAWTLTSEDIQRYLAARPEEGGTHGCALHNV